MTEVKNAILAGLSFTLLFGLLSGLLDGAMYGVHHALIYALIAAPISGLLFGVGMYFFVTSKIVARQTQIENTEGEPIIYSDGANHFKNSEAVGGKLYLLPDKLQFKSHSFNIQNHEQSLYLKQVKEVGFYNQLGLIPTGLSITMLDGQTEKFVVNKRQVWKEEIEKIRQRSPK